MKTTRHLLYGAILLAHIACNNESNNLTIAEKAISEKSIVEFVKEIGSDKFLGRKPFSKGEKVTLEFLQERYKEIGLAPAIGNSYLQDVPLVKIKGTVESPMHIDAHNSMKQWEVFDDFVAFSRQMTPINELNHSEMVFAGYGIVAPEYNWNDYEGLDVKGKTVVVLVNDPGLYSGREDFFTGNAMTYYGRWTYKYEEAARQGAAGCLIIHEDKGAGYPWSVVVNSAAVAKVYPVVENDYADRCQIEGWIHANVANQLFASLNQNLDSLKNEAKQSGFNGFKMDAKATMQLHNSWQKDVSHNVLGIIKGTDLADEYLFYSAHWDHLGIGKPMNGDSIYNGAVDNGTSLAWMMEIAKAFKAMPGPPRRSIVFFAPTAEESGLNGSGYYADNPIFPINKTVANINNDLMLPFGKCRDVMITGYGKSDLDDLVKKHAEKQGRYILLDPNAHTGMYYRSDHFSFARVGIPALFARGNNDHWEHGQSYMSEKEQYWINNCYHKPDDEYEEWWDVSGVAEDARLLFRVGWEIANTDAYPQWKAQAEFKAIRDKQFQ
ncbi:M28 family peptidase [Carboxylicivirga sediminis]|uniref:M28 family peptidase n=1 Tax=Carboxylicivirga sediminis TaxID=2006564 RepID=A0A941J382_9BACT|nr:M28 family metallopeptidase [Carboxylicivirga sediminis]MBR8538287.1 M28 family peptidase [Carboxylicivirga sediminis]